MNITDPNDIVIKLTPDEALVLFEILWRFEKQEKLEIIDSAEKRALWNLQACLEKILLEPFEANYDELLSDAKDRLKELG